ncbi:MAG: glutamine--fructose-6-phosphate transaminase (isomerizing) [Proteobacteria bacterium]|nr:glutamine--fructose-6-phosphate transaminase (isomerizing) [Pseudomonadota bacterium]
MCGIVGAVTHRNAAVILLEGLRRLEYRGYDSAGIAVLDDKDNIQRQRTEGKVKDLAEILAHSPMVGKIGIAHTRWATHGIPVEHNAHPHISNGQIVLVHNGIIENHEPLRQELIGLGYKFSSETDSETVAHLIHHQLKQESNLTKAVAEVAKRLEGAYALGVMDQSYPDRLVAVRQGCPLVVGLGKNENFFASDANALLHVVNHFMYLEEGDIAEVSREQVNVFDINHKPIKREIHVSDLKQEQSEKGNYRHYMQKEIFEQPAMIEATLEGRLGKQKVLEPIFGEKSAKIFDKVQRVQIVACGTSYHAGMVARYWFEELAGIPCQVEVASEFRYRKMVVEPNTLFVCISQSGETLDTLAALRLAKTSHYLATLAICNVPQSTLVRESDLVFMTRAGIEIGVASTKAFTTQLTALLLLTITLGKRNHLSKELEDQLVQELKQLPAHMQQVLNLDGTIKKLAEFFADKSHALFLGRGSQYPVALEGALKLKEISYIHAEAYPAGELKHGPLALVDKDMPVVAIAPNDELLEKLKSNLQEVSARGGKLFVFADHSAQMKNGLDILITEMPTVNRIIAPIIYTVPLQLLAYHVAVLKGTDVDQPRNLAKSVTVE